MFKELLETVMDKVNLHMDVSSVGSQMAVTIHCVPKAERDKDAPPLHVVPFTISGTADDMDREFGKAIREQLGKVIPFVTNLEAFEKDLKAQEGKQAEEKKAADKKTSDTKKSAEKKDKEDSKPAVDIKEFTSVEKGTYTKMQNAIKQAKEAKDEMAIDYLEKQVEKSLEKFNSKYKEAVRAEAKAGFDAAREIFKNKPVNGNGGMFTEQEQKDKAEPAKEAEAQKVEAEQPNQETKPASLPITRTPVIDDDPF